MRIWDLEPKYLCHKHLLGEHRELHALWSILINDKKGFRHHPETKRWEDKLAALYIRHEILVKEFDNRNYQHNTPLDKKFASGSNKQDKLLQTIQEQKQILQSRHCNCPL